MHTGYFSPRHKSAIAMKKDSGMYRTGKWGDKRMFFNNLTSTVWKDVKKTCLQRVGLQGEAIVIENIDKFQSTWADLDKDYAKYKQRKGFSNKKLVKTSMYFQSITSWTEGNVAYIGIKKTARNKDGESVANIARVMEFGSKARKIPARELWKPSKENLRQWLKKNDVFRAEMAKALRRHNL